MSSIADKISAFIELSERERDLKHELDNIKKAKDRLEPEILEHWVDNEIQSQRVRGNTLYLHTQTWASAGDNRQRAVEALRAAGLEDLITVNSQTLSAFVREKQANGEALPPEVQDTITITERVSLRARRGS